LDGEQFTLENALLRSFDMIARQQLDPIWHQVSARTKQLIGDLRLLRQLLS
jgi:DNA excision repair protein ERCC-4